MNTSHDPWTPDMPVVSVTVIEPDLLDVKVFGIPYNAPVELGPLTRGGFGQVMDHLYDRLRQPFSVELIETDGTRQSGTIDLREKSKTSISIREWAGTDASSEVPEPAHVPIEAAGFLSGEDIFIAYPAYTANADDKGSVRFSLPPEYDHCLLILLGRTSGTVLVRQPRV